MNGLRIYVNRKVTVASGCDQVFYSRRSMGPYYRWSYEETPKQWRVARMHSDDFFVQRTLHVQLEKHPSLLQVTLKVHYDE